MSAAEALGAARAAGVSVAVDGDSLLLEAAAPPPVAVLSLLARHKGDIVRILRPDSEWPAEEWRAWFDERAAIEEFDGGLTRPEAETLAFDACVDEWVAKHMPAGDPLRCIACGEYRRNAPVILPLGAGRKGAVGFHHGCWPAWQTSRRLEAAAALRAAGVPGTANRSLRGDSRDG